MDQTLGFQNRVVLKKNTNVDNVASKVLMYKDDY